MPIWIVRSGSSTPSSTACRNGPPWWNFAPSNSPDVSQWASTWIMPSGRSLPSALRMARLIEWSPPTASVRTRAVRAAERIGPYEHVLKCVPSSEAHVADIGDLRLARGHAFQHVLVGADALGGPHRP